MWRSFIKVRKETEKASDIDIRRGRRTPPFASVSKGVIYFFNKSKECFKVVKILLDPLPQFTF